MNNIYKSIISILLCITLVDSTGILQGAFALPLSVSNPVDSLLESNLKAFVHIDEYFQPDTLDSPFVIHIRDLHANSEAQMNIARVLELVWKSYQKNIVVLAEGAQSEVDTSLFGSFPDKAIKQEASETFMREGKLTGPEYLSIVRYGEVPMKIRGIEDGKLYIESLRIFREVIGKKDSTELFLSNCQKIMEEVKHKVFSKELLEIESLHKKLKLGQFDYGNAVAVLQNYMTKLKDNIQEFQNLKLFLNLLEKQKKIALNQLEKEKSSLIDELAGALEKNDAQRMVKKSLEFRLGQLSQEEYFEYLWNHAVRLKKDIGYPELGKYFLLLKEQSNIDWDKLFQEMDQVMNQLKDLYIQNEDQKRLMEFLADIEVLRKILILEASRDEWDAFIKKKSEWDMGHLQKEIEDWVERYGVMTDAIEWSPDIKIIFEEAKQFYEKALKRDHMMVKKALGVMHQNKNFDNIPIIVTGGFHSSGVTQLLKEQGIGYLVLTPKILNQPEFEKYYALMLDQRIGKQTISFFSLFDEIASEVSPELQEQELLRFVEVFLLTAGKRLGVESLRNWLKMWQEGKAGRGEVIRPVMTKILDQARQMLSAPDQERKVLTAADIEVLMRSQDETLKKLTIKVLEIMNDPLETVAKEALEKSKQDIKSPDLIESEKRRIWILHWIDWLEDLFDISDWYKNFKNRIMRSSNYRMLLFVFKEGNVPPEKRKLYTRLYFVLALSKLFTYPTKLLLMGALVGTSPWLAPLAIIVYTNFGATVTIPILLYFKYRHNLAVKRAMLFVLIPDIGVFVAVPAQILGNYSIFKLFRLRRINKKVEQSIELSHFSDEKKAKLMSASFDLSKMILDYQMKSLHHLDEHLNIRSTELQAEQVLKKLRRRAPILFLDEKDRYFATKRFLDQVPGDEYQDGKEEVYYVDVEKLLQSFEKGQKLNAQEIIRQISELGEEPSRIKDDKDVTHMSAEVKPDLIIHESETQTYESLKNNSLTFNIVNGNVEFAPSPELEKLEQAMGVGVDISREDFYKKLGEIIRTREKLQGRDLNATNCKLHLGDLTTASNEVEQKAYKTLFGNHKKDHAFYLNIRGLLNIQDKSHRRALFLTGISHEAVHEFLPQDQQTEDKIEALEKFLAGEDAVILKRQVSDRVAFLSNLAKVAEGSLLDVSRFLDFWFENFLKPRKRNVPHAMVNALSHVGEADVKDVKVRIYPDEDGVVGVLRIEKQETLAMKYTREKGIEVYPAGEAGIRGREGRQYDWEWIEGKFSLERIKKILEAGRGVDKVGNLWGIYESYVNQLGITEAEEKTLRSNLATAVYYCVKRGQTPDKVIKIYLDALKLKKEELSLEEKKQLIIATYAVTINNAEESLKNVIVLYGNVLDEEIPAELRQQWIKATYTVAMKRQANSLERVIGHYGKVLEEKIPETLKLQWLIATSRVAMEGRDESLKEVMKLYHDAVGDLPEELTQQWLIATCSVAMNGQEGSLKKVIEIYQGTLGKNIPKDLLRQWLIATYQVAMGGNDESLKKVIELYQGVLGEEIPEALRQQWLMATYKVAKEKKGESLRRVIELYENALGGHVSRSTNIRSAFLTATHRVAKEGKEESLEKAIRFYGEVLGNDIPKKLRRQWLNATSVVAVFGREKLLENVLRRMNEKGLFATKDLAIFEYLIRISALLTRNPEREIDKFLKALDERVASQDYLEVLKVYEEGLSKEIVSVGKDVINTSSEVKTDLTIPERIVRGWRAMLRSYEWYFDEAQASGRLSPQARTIFEHEIALRRVLLDGINRPTPIHEFISGIAQKQRRSISFRWPNFNEVWQQLLVRDDSLRERHSLTPLSVEEQLLAILADPQARIQWHDIITKPVSTTEPGRYIVEDRLLKELLAEQGVDEPVVLDRGASTGVTSEELQKHLGGRVIAVDLQESPPAYVNPLMLVHNMTEQPNVKYSDIVQFRQADVTQVYFEDLQGQLSVIRDAALLLHLSPEGHFRAVSDVFRYAQDHAGGLFYHISHGSVTQPTLLSQYIFHITGPNATDWELEHAGRLAQSQGTDRSARLTDQKLYKTETAIARRVVAIRQLLLDRARIEVDILDEYGRPKPEVRQRLIEEIMEGRDDSEETDILRHMAEDILLISPWTLMDEYHGSYYLDHHVYARHELAWNFIEPKRDLEGLLDQLLSMANNTSSLIKMPVANGRFLFDSDTGELRPGPNFGFKAKNNYTLIRHGQTDWNIEQRYQGETDVPLNDTGQQQARQTAENLFFKYEKDIRAGRLPVIYSSPLSRAYDTAQAFQDLVRDRLGIELPINIEPDLKEMAWGEWGGKTKEECRQANPDLYERFNSGKDFGVKAPGLSDSGIELLKKAQNVYEQLEARHQGQELLIFGHGQALGMMSFMLGNSAAMDEQDRLDFMKARLDNAQFQSYAPVQTTSNLLSTSDLPQDQQVKDVQLETLPREDSARMLALSIQTDMSAYRKNADEYNTARNTPLNPNYSEVVIAMTFLADHSVQLVHAPDIARNINNQVVSISHRMIEKTVGIISEVERSGFERIRIYFTSGIPTNVIMVPGIKDSEAVRRRRGIDHPLTLEEFKKLERDDLILTARLLVAAFQDSDFGLTQDVIESIKVTGPSEFLVLDEQIFIQDPEGIGLLSKLAQLKLSSDMSDTGILEPSVKSKWNDILEAVRRYPEFNDKIEPLEKLFLELYKVHQRQGAIGEGYHRFEHTLEVAYLAFIASLNLEDGSKEQALEVLVAGLLHDLDVSRKGPRESPKVINTLWMLLDGNEDHFKLYFSSEEAQRDVKRKIFPEMIHLLEQMGFGQMARRRMATLIYTTDFPSKGNPHFAKANDKEVRIQNANHETGISSDLMKQLSRFLVLADRAGSYVALNSTEAEERVRGLAREMNLPEDLVVDGTPWFFEQFLLQDVGELLRSLPDPIRSQYERYWESSQEYFLTKSKEKIRSILQAASVEANRTNKEIEIVLDLGQLWPSAIILDNPSNPGAFKQTVMAIVDELGLSAEVIAHMGKVSAKEDPPDPMRHVVIKVRSQVEEKNHARSELIDQIVEVISNKFLRQIKLSDSDLALIDDLIDFSPEKVAEVFRQEAQEKDKTYGVLSLHVRFEASALKYIYEVLAGEVLTKDEIGQVIQRVYEKHIQVNVYIPDREVPVLVDIDKSLVEMSVAGLKLGKIPSPESLLYYEKEALLEGRADILPKVMMDHMHLSQELFYSRRIRRLPNLYLRQASIGDHMKDAFDGLPGHTCALGFNVVRVRNNKGQNASVLAVSALGIGNSNILQTWVVLDDGGQFIPLEHVKFATLPGAYIERQDLYDLLAKNTYAFVLDKDHVIDPEDGWVVESVGHEWVQFPQITESEKEVRQGIFRKLKDELSKLAAKPYALSTKDLELLETLEGSWNANENLEILGDESRRSSFMILLVRDLAYQIHYELLEDILDLKMSIEEENEIRDWIMEQNMVLNIAVPDDKDKSKIRGIVSVPLNEYIDDFFKGWLLTGKIDTEIYALVHEFIAVDKQKEVLMLFMDTEFRTDQIEFIALFLKSKNANEPEFLEALGYFKSNVLGSSENVKDVLENSYAYNLKKMDDLQADKAAYKELTKHALPETMMGKFPSGSIADYLEIKKLLDYMLEIYQTSDFKNSLKIISDVNSQQIVSESGRKFEIEVSRDIDELARQMVEHSRIEDMHTEDVEIDGKSVKRVVSNFGLPNAEEKIELARSNFEELLEKLGINGWIIFLKDPATGKKIPGLFAYGTIDDEGNIWIEKVQFKLAGDQGLAREFFRKVGENLKGLNKNIQVACEIEEINTLITMAEYFVSRRDEFYNENLRNIDELQQILETAKEYRDQEALEGYSSRRSELIDGLKINLLPLLKNFSLPAEIVLSTLWGRLYQRLGLEHIQLEVVEDEELKFIRLVGSVKKENIIDMAALKDKISNQIERIYRRLGQDAVDDRTLLIEINQWLHQEVLASIPESDRAQLIDAVAQIVADYLKVSRDDARQGILEISLELAA